MEQGGFVLAAVAGHGHQAGVLSKHSIADVQVLLEEFIQVLYGRFDILFTANMAKAPYDLYQVMDRISQGGGSSDFYRMFRVLIVVFALALSAEFLLRRLVLSRLGGIAPEGDRLHLAQRLWLLWMQAIPEGISLIFFVAASYYFYVQIYADLFSGICPLFLSLLTMILVARGITLVSYTLFSCGDGRIRVFPLGDVNSKVAHRCVQLFAWIVAGGSLCVSLFEHAGLQGDSKLTLRLFFGSLYIQVLILLLHLQRKRISTWMQEGVMAGMAHWLRSQILLKWYPLSLVYILLIWGVWVVQMVIVGPEFGIAYGVSIFVVPFFLVFDAMLGRLLLSINGPEAEALGLPSLQGDAQSSPDPNVAFCYFRMLSRLFLGLLMVLWIMDLWGQGLVFSEVAKGRALEIVGILSVAYLLWQGLTKIISDSLANRAKAQTENGEDEESEWGDSPLLDRGQTLLPLLRKFSGVVMVLLVFLLILSTLGINIRPLLAGAGVMGIAIGFGAQKLVSDILSGFFFLLDDAFRVGEYIKTAAISGAVEKITLRNVMLRHHRGMLQIVPYSDLGAITNYMRGGIVVKFNLQFSYDIDVEQVRKVIKKVGVAMLNDPEFGKNFIKQVKSQGIREVADSVLTIRVKFTAQPGTHFLIRREAYRRITEALAAKGVFYAHRKVIVEVPPIREAEFRADPVSQRLTRVAGAAAASSLGAAATPAPAL